MAVLRGAMIVFHSGPAFAIKGLIVGRMGRHMTGRHMTETEHSDLYTRPEVMRGEGEDGVTVFPGCGPSPRPGRGQQPGSLAPDGPADRRRRSPDRPSAALTASARTGERPAEHVLAPRELAISQ